MSKYKRDYFEEMNIDYEELKDYKDVETYYDEIQDFTNLLKELQCDRVECQKYIVRANKEIERLNKKYDKALELLQDFNMPCECVNCKIPDEYCEENCSVDCECYKKCWNKYIELELKEGK